MALLSCEDNTTNTASIYDSFDYNIIDSIVVSSENNKPFYNLTKVYIKKDLIDYQLTSPDYDTTDIRKTNQLSKSEYDSIVDIVKMNNFMLFDDRYQSNDIADGGFYKYSAYYSDTVKTVHIDLLSDDSKALKFLNEINDKWRSYVKD